MHNIRLNFDKLKNRFKNIDKKKAISTILVIALVVSSLGLLGSLFGSSSGGGSGGSSGSSSGGNSNADSSVLSYSISFDSNGGTGTMENQNIAVLDSAIVYTNIASNTFTHSADGWYFTGWNTARDGSGTSYTDGQRIGLRSNITLYAQWTKDVTISYYKIYACDWEDIYPPADNSGPVSNSDGEDYLIVTLDGVSLDYLGDKFTEEGNTSPVRTADTHVGSELRIQLNNKGDKERGAVYVNDVKVEGNAKNCDYTFYIPDSSNITVTFTWETEGTVILGDDNSYWICRIYYS